MCKFFCFFPAADLGDSNIRVLRLGRIELGQGRVWEGMQGSLWLGVESIWGVGMSCWASWRAGCSQGTVFVVAPVMEWGPSSRAQQPHAGSKETDCDLSIVACFPEGL